MVKNMVIIVSHASAVFDSFQGNFVFVLLFDLYNICEVTMDIIISVSF